MKLYISGPMTGVLDLNFPAFNSLAETLRSHGHEVENPAEINLDPSADWASCMRVDLLMLDACEGIVMLPGWDKSPGAQIERLWAIRTGKQVFCTPWVNEVPA